MSEGEPEVAREGQVWNRVPRKDKTLQEQVGGAQAPFTGGLLEVGERLVILQWWVVPGSLAESCSALKME